MELDEHAQRFNKFLSLQNDYFVPQRGKLFSLGKIDTFNDGLFKTKLNVSFTDIDDTNEVTDNV